MLSSMIFYSAGEYLSKLWSLNPSWLLFAAIYFIYPIGIICWLPALRMHGQLSALSTVWSVLAIITSVLMGVYLFGEVLETRQIIGIILAIVACFLTY
jgi:drug/metabolite transporter (DMT)-like permease